MSIPRVAVAVAQAAVMLLAAVACGGERDAPRTVGASDPLVARHPAAWVEVPGTSLPGEPGSYTKRVPGGQLWADAIGVPTPLSPSVVQAGARYAVEVSKRDVTEIRTTWWRAEVEPEPIPHIANDRLFWRPSSGDRMDIPPERMPREPGRYLLKVWVSFGDSSIGEYAWYLEVR
jgi:hypothetical protein